MSKLNLPHSMQPDERGQSLVETSFGLLVLLILLMGLVDLGRLYIVYVALEDAAGEAALYVSLNPDCKEPPDLGGGPECANPNNGRYRAENAGAGVIDLSAETSNAEFTVFGPIEVVGVGDQIDVEITYDFQLLTPLIIEIAGDSKITLTGTATQLIITE